MLNNVDYVGITALITAIGTLITVIVSNILQLRSMKANSDKNKTEIKADIEAVAVAVDGKMEQLLNAEKAKSKLEGVKEEQKAESVRRTEGNEDNEEDRRAIHAKQKHKPKV